MDNIEYEVFGAECTSDYKRFKPNNPLHRPPVNYRKFTVALLGFFAVIAAVYGGTLWIVSECGITEQRLLIPLLASSAAGLVYVSVIAKKAVIWCVKAYQHYAPDSIRLKCVFEPSCSEYMILAVEKYGVIKGVSKGINRLLRCHPPGGIDYP